MQTASCLPVRDAVHTECAKISLAVNLMRVQQKTATLEGVMTTIYPPLPLDSNINMKECITSFEATNRLMRNQYADPKYVSYSLF